MQITQADLLRIIGAKEAEIDQLRRLIQQMRESQQEQAAVEKPKRGGKKDDK